MALNSTLSKHPAESSVGRKSLPWSLGMEIGCTASNSTAGKAGLIKTLGAGNVKQSRPFQCVTTDRITSGQSESIAKHTTAAEIERRKVGKKYC